MARVLTKRVMRPSVGEVKSTLLGGGAGDTHSVAVNPEPHAPRPLNDPSGSGMCTYPLPRASGTPGVEEAREAGEPAKDKAVPPHPGRDCAEDSRDGCSGGKPRVKVLPTSAYTSGSNARVYITARNSSVSVGCRGIKGC